VAVAESVEELLRQLTGGTPGESAAEVYARWQGMTVDGDASLAKLVYQRLTANGKGAQIRESLEATIRAGGGGGESLEQMLLRTGLTGWA
jgi:hypothetical protein